MELSKVLNFWVSRLTWAVQREHVARVIRGVEIHKATAAFMHLAAEYGGREGSVPGGRPRGQRGWRPNYRTGWNAFGLTGGMAGVGVFQDLAV